MTRRYVRNPAEHGLGRNKCPEEVLLYIIHEIRKLRRENMDKAVQTRLRKEDEREERELRSFVAQSITHEMINSLPGAVNTPNGTDVVKSIEERQREMEAQQLLWRGQDSH